jgi:hypothetical protein
MGLFLSLDKTVITHIDEGGSLNSCDAFWMQNALNRVRLLQSASRTRESVRMGQGLRTPREAMAAAPTVRTAAVSRALTVAPNAGSASAQPRAASIA